MASYSVLSLCAGYGGLDLGLRIARPGARTVCYVEREITAAEVLAARIEGGTLDDAPVWSDLKTFDGKPWRGKVDSITAGYPCQPFSAAGKRKGARDPRHLWPHVARTIREVEPREVFLENVEGHLSLGFYEVARELRRMGYGVEAGLFSAEEVGASHRRKRLFALAYREGGRCRELRESPGSQRLADRRDEELENAARLVQHGRWRRGIREAGAELEHPTFRNGWDLRGVQRNARSTRPRRTGHAPCSGDELAHAGCADHRRNTDASSFEGKWSSSRASGTGGNVADAEQPRRDGSARQGLRTDGPSLQAARSSSEGRELADVPLFAPGPADFDSWRKLLEIDPTLEPALCRIADGSPSRVDRLRALGNGVVPLVAALAYRTLADAHEITN